MKRKTNFFTSFILAGCLLMNGCLSGDRGWLTFRKTGENASLAASGAEAKINAEQTREVQKQITKSAEEIRRAAREIQKHNSAVVEVISEDAPQILSKTNPHTSEIQTLAADTEDRAKELEEISKGQEKWLARFKKFASHVVDESQGKTKIPMTLIILLWLIGIGIALSLINQAIPLKLILTPFANIFNAIFDVIISVLSGTWREEQELKYEHWDRTATIDNSEMPEHIQYKIFKHRTRKAKNGNDKTLAVDPHRKSLEEEKTASKTKRRSKGCVRS